MDRDEDWSENWSRRTVEEIASAWIDFQSRPHDPTEDMAADKDWWACDAVMGLTYDDPLKVLEICFVVARSSDDPNVLIMLGAGPLEDLLSNDPTLIDPIAIELPSNPNVAKALRHTWQGDIPDDVGGRCRA